MFATLQDLGMSEVRVRDALLRMSSAGDLLSDSLDRSATAWDENTALIEEAERRYDTAESKIQVAKNTLVDLAIDVGSVLLPALVNLVELGTDIIAFFADLPAPLQTAATWFALLFGAAALLGGGFLLLAPRIAAAQALMLSLARTAPVMYGAMAYTGQFLGLLGGLAAVAAAFAFLRQTAGDTSVGVGQATEALIDLRQGVSNELIDDLARLHGRLDDADRVLGIIPTSLGGFRMSAKEAAETTNEFEANVEALDQALAHMVASGDPDKAAEAVEALGTELGLTGDALDAFVQEHFPQYVDSLAAVEAEHKEAAESVEPVDQALLNLATRFGLTGEDAEKAAQQLVESWVDAGTQFVDALDAYETALADKEEAEREAAQATADATEDASDSWEDYVEDVELTVDEYLEQLERMVTNQREWRNNLVELAGRASDEMLSHLISLGPEGADLVALFASMTDDELAEAERLWSHSTEGSVQAGIIDPIIEAGPVLEQVARDHGDNVADKLREHMIKHEVDVFTAARRLGIKIDDGLREGEDRDIPVKITGYDNVVEKIRSIGEEIGKLPDGKSISVTASGKVFFDGRPIHVATGGEIRGPGGPTDDRAGIFALSDGEFVVNARDAQRNLGLLKAINAGMPIGGPVSRVDVEVDSSDLKAADFGLVRDRVSGAAVGASATSSGKVLPPGSYRIGRGPAAHGYNARDLPAPTGTPVYAAAMGMVTRAQRLGYSYGIHAAIQHAGWRSLYAHMSQMYVRAGQEVRRGQMIGRVGSTGNSTGPHLHLEPDNPRLYDRGGKWAHGTLGLNTSGGTEYVLSPEQSRMFDRMISVMEGMARGGDGAAVGESYHFHGVREDAIVARLERRDRIRAVQR